MNYQETRERLIKLGIAAGRLPEIWTFLINLSGANLSGANLSGANLSEANLREANLRGADGDFTIGYFGQHHAIAAGGYIFIGCEQYTYDEWLEGYEAIGRANDYSDDEIADYGVWIKLAVARQRRIQGGG